MIKTPNNIWAIRGLIDAHRKRDGPGDMVEVAYLSRCFDVLLKKADFEPKAACACAVASGAYPPLTNK